MPNPLSSLLAGRRFRPTLWPTLGLVVVVALTVSLGNWQRNRAAEKEALRAQYERNVHQPPLELTASAAAAAAERFRPVRARGEFDAARQVLIDNKVRAGRPGFDVVAPLRLAGADRYVLVDRGWVAQGANRAELPFAPPPAGPVSVTGRINLPPARYLELRSDAGTGPIRENLDIDRIAATTGLPLLPFLIEQGDDAGDSLVRDWPAPDFGIEVHRGYMLQWYTLAGLGIVLWLVLNWRVPGVPGDAAAPPRPRAGSPPGAAPAAPRGRRTLLLVALVALAPIVASYVAYYGFAPTKRVNYGELLDVQPAAEIVGAYADGRPFALAQLRGKWVLLFVGGSRCDDPCRRALHATGVARTIQGAERDRVVRAWLAPLDATPPPTDLLAADPDLVGARAQPAELARLPIRAGTAGILLLDPHGNLVLRYGDDPDVERLAKDLQRLLRVSQIG